MTLTRLRRTMTKIYQFTTRMLFSHAWETVASQPNQIRRWNRVPGAASEPDCIAPQFVS
jgi:hypothetical protein